MKDWRLKLASVALGLGAPLLCLLVAYLCRPEDGSQPPPYVFVVFVVGWLGLIVSPVAVVQAHALLLALRAARPPGGWRADPLAAAGVFASHLRRRWRRLAERLWSGASQLCGAALLVWGLAPLVAIGSLLLVARLLEAYPEVKPALEDAGLGDGNWIPLVIFPTWVLMALGLSLAARSLERRQPLRTWLLSRLASRLEGGSLRRDDANHFFVEGRRHGRIAAVAVQGEHVTVEVRLEDHAAELHVSRPDLLGRLSRRLGGAPATPEGPLDGAQVQGPDEGPRRRVQSAEALAALEALFDAHDYEGVAVSGGALRATAGPVTAYSLRAGELLGVLDALCGLARALDRREVTLAGGARRFAWTGGGADVRCPFCRDVLPAEPAACERCGTLHHAECLAEAGGCTVFGCGGQPQRSGDARKQEKA